MIDWLEVRTSIPMDPGVYQFIDHKGQRLYIGKANVLRKRVASYFTKKHQDPRLAIMLKKAERIETVIVNNEVEALLLENELIKEHQPRYNINLKDAKTYAYIELTDHEYPRLRTTRRRSKHGELFGPYTDGTARRQIIRLAQRIYKLRTCRTLPKRSCLNYHIGLCTAPCIGNVTKDEYTAQVDAARTFLKGETKEAQKMLESEMRQAAERLEYEVALERKRELEAIALLSEKQSISRFNEHDQDVFALASEPSGKAIITALRVERGVISGTRDYRFRMYDELFEAFLKAYYQERRVPKEVLVSSEFWTSEEDKLTFEAFLSELRGQRCYLICPQRGPKRDVVLLAEKNAKANLSETKVLRDIKRALNLPELPLIIECFDMSNLQGTDIVGGMTRFVDAQPDPSGYRKFGIKSVSGKPDDVASMGEAVWRRYKRLKEEGAQLPDLIIIDGGKGQLLASLEQLRLLDLSIPIVSLAKREEELFTPGATEPLRFDPESEMMRFIRRVRDETHRFVLTYNRKRREMRLRDQSEEL